MNILKRVKILVFAASVLALPLAGCGGKGDQGPAGENGISINWLGSLSTAPTSPVVNDAYYNTADGKSYVWDGSAWQVLTQDGTPGADGISVSWLGTLGAAPSAPSVNDAYYNTTAGISYIWDGSAWQILSQNGAVGSQGPAGTNGTNGTNGISINWLGSLAMAPSSPALNDAYYNTADKTSYIWGGTSWQVLAKDGATGAQGPQGPQGLQGLQGIQGPPGPTGNLYPVIASITIYPQPATAARFACNAYDQNGDTLSYAWKVGGVYPRMVTGPSWYWYSQGIPGYYQVDVRVSDGQGAVVSGSSFMNVSSGSPWPRFRRDIQSNGISPYAGPVTNTVKWSYTVGGGGYTSPAIGADGTIYINRGAGLKAINPDGTLKWSSAYGGSQSSPAVGADGTIYVGSDNFSIDAVNPDGTIKWQYSTLYMGNGRVWSSPAVGADGTVYAGADSGRFYAVYPDGTFKWMVLGNGDSSPTIGADGTVYFGGGGGLSAVNPDGTSKWGYSMGGTGMGSPAVGADGTIYIGSSDHNFYALNPNGTLKWSYSTGDSVGSSPAIGADGTIYIGSMDGKLYVLNPEGMLKWSYSTGGWMRSSPAIGADGTIYIGSSNDKIYAINPNGTTKWRYTTGGNVDSSPAIGADGTLYIISDDGNLYAIGQ